MSQFTYSDYQTYQESRASEGGSIGYFKLKDNGEEALVRINCPAIESLIFASIHSTGSVDNKWYRISCLNPIGASGDACPLCARAKADPNSRMVGKSMQRVFLQMLVAYKDPMTGQFSAAIPVIWERPAPFSREIANKLKDFGDLRNHVFKITRNGAPGDMKTTYSLDYVPIYDKPELVPVDFSAFEGYQANHHAYWEKTPAEMNEFLMTGVWPQKQKDAAAASVVTQQPFVPPVAAQQPTPAYQAPVAPTPAQYATPAPAGIPAQQPTPAVNPFATPVAPQAAPTPAETPIRAPAAAPTDVPPLGPSSGDRPVRNFQGFAF